MNQKDGYINDSSFKKLLHNDDYYRHIFKKTEKIVSVVFYILNNIDHNKKSETHIGNIASKAHFAHENALRTLEVKPLNATEVLEQFAQSLIGLDSALRIASVSGAFSTDVLHTVSGEIDAALRSLSSYISSNGGIESTLSAFDTPTTAPTPSRRPAAAPTAPKAAQRSASQTSVPSTTADRRTRISTILEAKGEATIKDISEIVTDCSEKTIQRELNAMIEDNVVKREGERRWSKYYLA